MALLAGGCATWLLLECTLPALAAGFSVNPVRLELKPTQNATSLTIANYNAEPLLMQVRVYRWEHKDNQEQLTEVDSEAPLVTPPLFRLAPNGGSQIVRIGFARGGAQPTEEHQWRVIAEEVPKAPVAAEASSEPSPPLSVAVHMRVSLPLFQRPLTVTQQLEWSLQRTESGALQLTAQNLGSITERLDELTLGPDDASGAKVSGPIYIFPGEHRAIDLRPKTVLPAGSVRLSVQGTPRPLVRDLVLSAQ